MVIKAFPEVDQTDSNGLLAIGGDLEPESLLLAYRNGIFPWPIEETLAWFSPPKRAILTFDKMHISKSLAKEIRRDRFRFSLNQAFPDVIEACSSLTNRKKDQATWITDEIIEAYIQLHQLGYAFSIESWLGEKLAGGIYGITIGKFVAGESMFYREPNASKLCLCFLAEHFKSLGSSWLDCQVMTPHIEAFGAEMVTRKKFQKMLKEALG